MSTSYKDQNEQKSINAFIEYFGLNPIKCSLIKEPKSDGKTPDFYIKDIKTLVELKAIYELSDNSESARWSSIVNGLKNELKINSKYLKLKDLYSVDTPRNIIIPRDKLKKYADDILDAILSKKEEVSINSYKFKINKFKSDIGDITFAGFGEVRSIDSAEIIYTNILKQVSSANEQLAFNGLETNKRVLLLSNKFYLGSTSDVVKALSKMYEKLIQFSNIEEIYLQIENDQNKTWHHELIYTRDFLTSFENKSIKSSSSTHVSLFEKWFWSFEDMPDKMENILNALHKLIDKNDPWKIFSDSGKRSSMVKFGDKVLESGDLENTRWLIDKFKDDPDPPIKYTDTEQEKYNLHQKILENEDVNSITTVQGHLAWLVKEYSRRSSREDIDNLVYAFELAEIKLLSKNQNLYAVLQWLFVLIEIANRRIWLANKNPETYKRFRKLLLDEENGLVLRYSKYKSIARNLVSIFYYFKDLTTEETEFVLKHLINSPEYDAILVYFSFFRERHYIKGSEAGDIFGKISKDIFNYSSNPAQKIVDLIFSDKEYEKIRGSIAWQFWKIIKDSSKEFSLLSEWISKLFDCPFERNLYSNLEMIIEETYGKKYDTKDVSHRWLVSYIETISNKSEELKRELWLSLDDVFGKVAERHPEDLVKILENLYIIWKNYGYIGDILKIFNLYKSIPNPSIKGETKNLCEKIYLEMKSVNPKILDITFE